MEQRMKEEIQKNVALNNQVQAMQK
jgi:hypothetical protein